MRISDWSSDVCSSDLGAGWTAGNAQPADYATPAAFKELSDWNGASNVLVNDYGVRRDIREMPREIIAGRTYRAHWRYRQNAAYAATVYIRHFAADGDRKSTRLNSSH